MNIYQQAARKCIELYHMLGGAMFKNTTKFFLMANITDKYIHERLNERRSALLDGKRFKNVPLHVTILQFEINQDNPNARIFFSEDFHKHLRKFFDRTLSHIVLRSRLGDYDILGMGDTKFFAKIYHPDDKMAITEFRMSMYQYLEFILGKPKIKATYDPDGNKQYVFYYPNSNKPLISVPEFNFGKAKWTPHVSIVNTNDLETYNDELYQKYRRRRMKSSQLNLLFNKIYQEGFKPIGEINFDTDVGSLSIALRNPIMKISEKFDI